jgi:hypothetical protein
VGLAWNALTDFPVPDDGQMLSFDEPHLVEAADGTIIAQFRDCNAPNRLWQSASTDGGRNWSAPRRTDIHGYPPHLLKLSNGWLLSTYGKRWPPFGEYASISRDHGKTWDVEHEIQLSEAASGDLGYPATVQLEDGMLWTVYYEIDQPCEAPCLKGTHWRLKQLPVPEAYQQRLSRRSSALTAEVAGDGLRSFDFALRSQARAFIDPP